MKTAASNFKFEKAKMLTRSMFERQMKIIECEGAHINSNMIYLAI